MTRPDVLTNLDDASVAAALAAWWRDSLEALKEPPGLAIASAYFAASGFDVLSDVLERFGAVRLLLGAEPDASSQVRSRRPLGPKPVKAERARTRDALARHQRQIVEDRDLQPFDVETDRLLKRLLAWLESGRVEVRRFEDGFLHGKAYLLEGNQGGVVVGSSNLTAAGLTRNVELNLSRFDAQPVAEVQDWFDRLWGQAKPFDLAGLYRDRFEPADPYVVYLRMLFERYQHELEPEKVLPRELPLTRFQKDGVSRAGRLLEEFGGVLVADGVGLGKTFIAGELIRQAVQERRQRALVIAPAALRDGPWKSFLHEYGHKHGFDCEVYSYDQLREDRQLLATGLVNSYEPLTGEVKDSDRRGRKVLKSPKDEYALVVIDEAHAFRNPLTRQADALRALLQGQPAKQLVLLTATPVNNSLRDLYELIRLFVRNDAAFLDAGIPSLLRHFQEADRQHPDTLSPDVLFDVLDAIAVRRTRRFVKRYYEGETIVVKGERVTLTFPQPTLKRIDYDFDAQMGSFFDDFAYALGADPDDEDNVLSPSADHVYDEDRRLTMARYIPSGYRLDEKGDGFEVQVSGLLRIALLKRFESSPYAFAQSCRTMARNHESFLEALDRNLVLTGAALKAFEQSEDGDIDLDEFTAGRHETADGYRLADLRADAARDRDLLLEFAAAADQVTNDLDIKLDLLIDELAEIVAEAQREAVGDQDERNRRKTLVFTYYTDTLDWIVQRLDRAVETDPRLELLRGRIASVSGRHRDHNVVLEFAPQSMEAGDGAPDRYDVLITTDVLAEGVNLQQARNIINFDLPWNPMRLVQRHGRIDRIGSPHDRVYLRTLFPTAKLDGMLALESTIRRKLIQAARSIGVEDDVIAGIEAAAERNFTEQVERIADGDTGILEELEATGALSGEEFRRELADALNNGYRDAVEQLPWVSGTGKRAKDAGFVFCARIADHHLPVYRYVPAPDGHIDRDAITGDTLRCLDLARCTPGTETVLPDHVRTTAYDAWEEARAHIYNDWTERTDPRNLQPKLSRAVREAEALLRENRPSEMNDADHQRLCDTLAARFEPRVERAFTDALKQPTTPARVTAIVRAIDAFGLTPPEPIKELPEIAPDDIHLVAWTALVKG
jgi:SNF2 family DNA or RNA helicase